MGTQNTLTLTVDLDPVSWKSHAGFGRRSFNPRYKEKEIYQWKLRQQYSGPIIKTAVVVNYVFMLKAPQSLSKKDKKLLEIAQLPHIKRPDLGNLEKFLSDCLIGIVFKDDSQIIRTVMEKFYSYNPRTIIQISPWLPYALS